MKDLAYELTGKELKTGTSIKKQPDEADLTDEEKNINKALPYLSRSLQYFYDGDYNAALKEIDVAIELNPNMALAYARKGSIYYKLGDVDMAKNNWNLALRLDPEHPNVKNILNALENNKIKSDTLVDGHNPKIDYSFNKQKLFYSFCCVLIFSLIAESIGL